MFDNITEKYLWEIARNSVKVADADTTKMLYDGEERGQTERYFIVVSRLIKDLLNTTETLYQVNDGHKCPDDLLDIVLHSKGLTYLPADLGLEKKRELLKYYPILKRQIGTRVFAEWMIWMVLGFEISSMTREVPTNLLATYDELLSNGNVTLYEDGNTDVYVLFDDMAAWVLTIIIPPGDPELAVKRAWLTAQLPEWLLSSELQI